MGITQSIVCFMMAAGIGQLSHPTLKNIHARYLTGKHVVGDARKVSKVFQSTKGTTQIHSLRLLRLLGFSESSKTFRAILSSGARDELQEEALLGLIRLPDKRAHSVLVRALNSEQSYLAKLSALALARLGTKRATAALMSSSEACWNTDGGTAAVLGLGGLLYLPKVRKHMQKLMAKGNAMCRAFAKDQYEEFQQYDRHWKKTTEAKPQHSRLLVTQYVDADDVDESKLANALDQALTAHGPLAHVPQSTSGLGPLQRGYCVVVEYRHPVPGTLVSLYPLPHGSHGLSFAWDLRSNALYDESVLRSVGTPFDGAKRCKRS